MYVNTYKYAHDICVFACVFVYVCLCLCVRVCERDCVCGGVCAEVCVCVVCRRMCVCIHRMSCIYTPLLYAMRVNTLAFALHFFVQVNVEYMYIYQWKK